MKSMQKAVNSLSFALINSFTKAQTIFKNSQRDTYAQNTRHALYRNFKSHCDVTNDFC